MAYSIEQAEALTQQLEKFTTSYAHHLVGQFANLDFWLDETNHAVAVLDNYPKRFVAMRDAQREWVDGHQTVVSGCRICRGTCEFDPRRPTAPTRLPTQELDAARRRLKDAAYKLLLRCYRTGLLGEVALKVACKRVGTSVDLDDIRLAQE